jgi:hypothetical protein
MFRHPKYYKELRKRALDERNKTDQAISKQQATASSTRSPGSGHKPQASSAKLTDPQATSDKHQAPRHKRQA